MGFIARLFSPKIPSVQTPSVTGRDLVDQTTAKDPESAVMGTEQTSDKKKGVKSLLVQNESIYKGSV